MIRICKRLSSPGIGSKETIPPAYVVWRAVTSNRVVVPARQAWNGFLGSIKGLQIWTQGYVHCTMYIVQTDLQQRGETNTFCKVK